MKKNKIVVFFLISFVFSACAKKNVSKTEVLNEPEVSNIQIEETVESVAEPVIEPVVEIPNKTPPEQKTVEPVVEIKEKTKFEESVIQEPKIEDIKEEKNENFSVADDEYKRSVGNIDVSRDTFVEDKAKILGIIEELSNIMHNKNYRAWVAYLDPESISYWQKPINLKKAQGRLPVKGLQLKTLEDYFKFIFIPARQNRTVTEIRYISDKYVKAIEVKEDVDYVYYYFNKTNGKWMIHLPELED